MRRSRRNLKPPMAGLDDTSTVVSDLLQRMSVSTESSSIHSFHNSRAIYRANDGGTSSDLDPGSDDEVGISILVRQLSQATFEKRVAIEQLQALREKLCWVRSLQKKLSESEQERRREISEHAAELKETSKTVDETAQREWDLTRQRLEREAAWRQREAAATAAALGLRLEEAARLLLREQQKHRKYQQETTADCCRDNNNISAGDASAVWSSSSDPSSPAFSLEHEKLLLRCADLEKGSAMAGVRVQVVEEERDRLEQELLRCVQERQQLRRRLDASQGVRQGGGRAGKKWGGHASVWVRGEEGLVAALGLEERRGWSRLSLAAPPLVLGAALERVRAAMARSRKRSLHHALRRWCAVVTMPWGGEERGAGGGKEREAGGMGQSKLVVAAESNSMTAAVAVTSSSEAAAGGYDRVAQLEAALQASNARIEELQAHNWRLRRQMLRTFAPQEDGNSPS